MGRNARGVRGMKLPEKQQVLSLLVAFSESESVLVATENGYGKRTSHSDFRVTNRGGKGIIGIVNSSRNGNVSSSFPVFEGDQILISTNKGRVIRTSVKEIRVS